MLRQLLLSLLLSSLLALLVGGRPRTAGLLRAEIQGCWLVGLCGLCFLLRGLACGIQVDVWFTLYAAGGGCKTTKVSEFVAAVFMPDVDQPAAFAREGVFNGEDGAAPIAVGGHVERFEVVAETDVVKLLFDHQ